MAAILGLVVTWVLATPAWAIQIQTAALPTQSQDRLAAELSRYRRIEFLSGNLSTSLDGRVLAFAIGGGYGRATATMILRRGSRGAQTERIPDASGPSVSPNGRFVAYRVEAAGVRQIWLRDLQSGRVRQLTNMPGGISDPAFGQETIDFAELSRIAWCPDSSCIAFAHARPRAPRASRTPSWQAEPADLETAHVISSNAPGLEPAAVAIVAPNGAVFGPRRVSRIVRGGASENSRLFIVRTEDGEVRDVGTLDANLAGPLFSPDGRNLYALSRQYESRPRTARVRTSVVAFDLTTGGMRTIAAPPGTAGMLALSPDGRWLAYVRSESTGQLPQSRNAAVIHRISDDREQVLATGFGPSNLGWTGARTLSLNGRAGVATASMEVNVVTGWTTSHSVTQRSTFYDTAYAPAAGAVFAAEQTPDAPLQIREVRLAAPLWTAGDPLGDLGAGRRYRPLAWRDAQGFEHSAMLILPASVLGAPRGLILNPYPGQARWGYDNAVDGDRILLDRGFAILHVNVTAPHTWFQYPTESRQPSGRGESGLIAMSEQLDAAIDSALAETHIDEGRVCGFGQSNGGGVISQYITRSSRLRCALIYAPAFVSWRTNSFMGDMDIVAHFLGGVYPWQNPSLYNALDAPSHADRVTAATLIAIGRQDWIFPLDAVALFNALRVAGKDTSLVVYDDQGHVFEGAAQLDLWRRKLAMFDHFMPDRASE